MMRIEWPTIGLILLCYTLWLGVGFYLWPVLPALALTIMALLGALHSSLVHECLHGHPTRHRLLNEALVALPLTWLHAYRRYKATHLAHHNDARLTDPMEDPESYYVARWEYRRMPRVLRGVLWVNNTLIGRMALGPWLAGFAFIASELRLVREDAQGVRLAWALHLPALLVVLALIVAMGIPLWLYLLAVCWPAMALISLRTFAEHQWHEAPGGRTIIVERSPLAWLFLHNNLHIVHHREPRAPWYELPRLYAERRAYWQVVNQGYVFPNYWALWRRYGVMPKEPVAHPALRFEPPVDAAE
ncbi:fatty acid desaturase [Pararhodobacter oceanensis]|uniref:fatty acid desaturase n=1 Tax=Pararhodobacter oceanensis TaxID=2172121 RepID=UPI003A8F4638